MEHAGDGGEFEEGRMVNIWNSRLWNKKSPERAIRGDTYMYIGGTYMQKEY